MNIETRKEIVQIHNGKESLKIFHLSDLHFRFSKKVSSLISISVRNELPDIILMTGDYFDIPKGYRVLAELVKEISSICPVVFIKGNHDNLYGQKFLAELGELENCSYLNDQTFQFKSKRGFDYTIYPSNVKVEKPKAETTNILLLHNPEKIKSIRLENISLILSGHLHGGQFIFWKSNSGHYYPGSFLYKYCVDRKTIGETILIVSKGLGDTLPMRFRCPKEIIEIQIT
ncbi:MAG: putative MPP superfamily phosphohydrolase [Crocinitomicaceae bacterium]|jgi:predicted MPP superfamily phosphohydrolase